MKGFLMRLFSRDDRIGRVGSKEKLLMSSKSMSHSINVFGDQ